MNYYIRGNVEFSVKLRVQLGVDFTMGTKVANI